MATYYRKLNKEEIEKVKKWLDKPNGLKIKSCPFSFSHKLPSRTYVEKRCYICSNWFGIDAYLENEKPYFLPKWESLICPCQKISSKEAVRIAKQMIEYSENSNITKIKEFLRHVKKHLLYKKHIEYRKMSLAEWEGIGSPCLWSLEYVNEDDQIYVFVDYGYGYAALAKYDGTMKILNITSEPILVDDIYTVICEGEEPRVYKRVK